MKHVIPLLTVERQKLQAMLDQDRRYLQYYQNMSGTGEEVPDGANVLARITYRVQLIDELDDAIEILGDV